MLIGLLPVFNEEYTVEHVLKELNRIVGYIIIVNDGSSDKSGMLIREWCSFQQNVTYIDLEKNKGLSFALRKGFEFIVAQFHDGKFSQNDVIVTIDADGQHSPEQINDMLTYFSKNHFDVVIGKRNFSNYPAYRILGNKLLSLLASLLGGYKFCDVECGFRIVTIPFIKELLDYYRGYQYSCAGEIGVSASLLGYKVDNNFPIQIPYYRKRGPRIKDLFINLFHQIPMFLHIKFARHKISSATIISSLNTGARS